MNHHDSHSTYQRSVIAALVFAYILIAAGAAWMWHMTRVHREGPAERIVDRIVLYDDAEREVASLGLNPKGGARLVMRNQFGAEAIRVGCDSRGFGVMEFLGVDGAPLLTLGVKDSSSIGGAIWTRGQSGDVMTYIGSSLRGTAGAISINGNAGKEIIAISETISGDGYIDVANRDGQVMCAVSVSSNGVGAISTRDRRQHPVTSLSHLPNRGGLVCAHDDSGSPALCIGSYSEGAGIIWESSDELTIGFPDDSIGTIGVPRIAFE